MSCSARIRTIFFIFLTLVLAQDQPEAQTPETSPTAGGPQARQKSPQAQQKSPQAQQKSPQAQQKSPQAQQKKDPWNVWENKAFSVTFLLTPLYDLSGFVQDANSKKQVGGQPTKGQFRAERFIFYGKLNFKRPWGYTFGWNFNGFEAAQGNRWSNMDARLDIPLFNLGTFKIGPRNWE
jgi:hypothetical protein